MTEIPREIKLAIAKARKKAYKEIAETSIPVKLRQYLSTNESGYRNFLRLREQAYPRYSLCYDRANISTVRFAVIMGDDICNYAYAYGEGISLQFFARGGSLASQDGEFRGVFNTLQAFEKNIYVNYGEIMNTAEEIIIERLDKGEIQIQVTPYPRHPATIEDAKKLAAIVDESRLAIKLLALCTITDVPRIHQNTAPNHINPIYAKIICGEGGVIYDRINNQRPHSSTKPGQLVDRYFYGNIVRLRVGQKCMPLTTGELFHVGNIVYSAWRELYVGDICMNHVLNSRCNAFPCSANWFLVNSQDADFYDNATMRKKFADSDICEDIIRRMQELQDQTFGVGPSFRSDAFRRSAQSINDAIINAKANIVLSDYSIAIMSEYVGNTLRDWYSYVNKDIEDMCMRQLYHTLGATFFHDDLFQGRLFELVYGFLTLNQSWIVHTDPHTNNMTLLHLPPPEAASVEKTYSLFLAGEKTYKVPITMLAFCIIDFSRAILGDLDKITADFNSMVAQELFVAQVPKMLHLISSVFPEMVTKNSAKIEELVLADFKLAIKVVSSLDVHLATSNIATLLESNPAYKAKHADLIAFVRQLSNDARALTLSNMLLWLDGKLDRLFQWPNLTLLHRNFSHAELSWTPEAFKDAQERRQRCLPDNASLIVDIFNFENPDTLDINNFDKWGPLNLKLGTQMIRDKFPDYFDPHTACVFEHAYDKPPGDNVIALAAQYKIDDPFAKSSVPLYSDLG